MSNTPAYASNTTPPPQWQHRIKAAREARSLTQTELAKAAGLERSNLSLIETKRREPSVTTLLRIARALGVRIDDLVDVEDDGKRLDWRCGNLERSEG